MAISRTTMKSRRGVTLLEVLVSIGVTSVGLLGVLALIPLGGAQTRQGQVAERCAVIGPSAFSEIRNRDMLSPTMWVEADGTAPVPQATPQSFCLDPQLVAAGGGTSKLVFPAVATSSMHRLSLRSGNPANVMSAAMAKSIFTSHDDLRLQVSQTDRTLPPVQLWNRSTVDAPANPIGTPADPSRRQSEGTISWMATVFPNRAKGSPSDLFTVSVVVFNRRVIDTSLKSEFTANVTSSPGGGVAGGDIVIDFSGLGYTNEEILEAKTPENCWVLLSGKMTHPTLGAIDVFEWYRVLASDNTTPLERQVTLAGPDWDFSKLVPNTLTQITVIPGTMAVYQRNVQLETGVSDGAGATLWRN